MTTDQIKLAIAAVLTTALETEPAFFPETMGYLAIGADIHGWTTIKGLMASANLATFTGNEIRLTDGGRALAKKINLIRDAAKARAAELEKANAPHRMPDFESYREECKARAACVHETPDTYTAEPPPNPKIEGETFYRAEPNAHGVTHVRPANTGMSYGLTEDGHVALIDNPSGTCVIRAILATFPTLEEARADFYRRQDNARNGGTIRD